MAKQLKLNDLQLVLDSLEGRLPLGALGVGVALVTLFAFWTRFLHICRPSEIRRSLKRPPLR